MTVQVPVNSGLRAMSTGHRRGDIDSSPKVIAIGSSHPPSKLSNPTAAVRQELLQRTNHFFFFARGESDGRKPVILCVVAHQKKKKTEIETSLHTSSDVTSHKNTGQRECISRRDVQSDEERERERERERESLDRTDAMNNGSRLT